jgi:hypothetical protein
MKSSSDAVAVLDPHKKEIIHKIFEVATRNGGLSGENAGTRPLSVRTGRAPFGIELA